MTVNSALPDDCPINHDQECPVVEDEKKSIWYAKSRLIIAVATLLTTITGAIGYYTYESHKSVARAEVKDQTARMDLSNFVRVQDLQQDQKIQDDLTAVKIQDLKESLCEVKATVMTNTKLLYSIAGKVGASTQ